MKKFFSMTAIAAAMFLPVASMASPTVYFVPADQNVGAGLPGSVGVWIGGSDVGSFDLNIHASNGNLTWNSAEYSAANPLGVYNADPDLSDLSWSVTISGQNIRVIANSILGAFGDPVPAAQTDPFLLFTLNFSAGASVGDTALSFTSLNGNPKLGTNITNWAGDFQAQTSFGTACVRVTSELGGQPGGASDCGGGNEVPEPSAFALAALALLAGGCASRGRRQGTAIAA